MSFASRGSRTIHSFTCIRSPSDDISHRGVLYVPLNVTNQWRNDLAIIVRCMNVNVNEYGTMKAGTIEETCQEARERRERMLSKSVKACMFFFLGAGTPYESGFRLLGNRAKTHKTDFSKRRDSAQTFAEHTQTSARSLARKQARRRAAFSSPRLHAGSTHHACRASLFLIHAVGSNVGVNDVGAYKTCRFG